MPSRLFVFLCCLLLLAVPPVGAAEKVTFGLREAAPLVYRVADGRLAGIEYELLEAIFKAANMTMEPYVGSNARLVVAANGAVVAGFAPVVGDGPADITLTDSYITYQNVAMTLAGRDIHLERPDDLRHWRVLAFQRASKVLGPEFAAAVAAAPDYREEPTQALQAHGLLFGRYDVVVAETRVLHYHIARVLAGSGSDTRLHLPVEEYRIFPPTPYRAGFRDAALAARFNEGLRRIQANGTYATIMARHSPTQ
ncbi:substrate-binding periplasmic protein [Niveispirillum fermenti]|uniref:substrate-binding periplasmic protein n=1 Tax=Niveispirillum fermenti TaxID=1233113 RepID=UPI003A878412